MLLSLFSILILDVLSILFKIFLSLSTQHPLLPMQNLPPHLLLSINRFRQILSVHDKTSTFRNHLSSQKQGEVFPKFNYFRDKT